MDAADEGPRRLGTETDRHVPGMSRCPGARRGVPVPARKKRRNRTEEMNPRTKLPTKGQLAADAVQDWCRRHGFTVPVTEHRFHPDRFWRFDLCWPDDMVAIELQGGIWQKGGGGHTRGKHYQDDCEKYSEAAILGWRLIQATFEQLESGKLFEWIERMFPEEKS